MEPYYCKLTEAEIKRNIRGDDRLYVSNKNSGYDTLKSLYQHDVDPNTECAIAFEGLSGTVLLAEECVEDGGYLRSPVAGLDTITDNMVICVRFRDPTYSKGHVFPAKKLKGAKDPLRVLKPGDLDQESNNHWRPQIGMAPATQRAYLGQPGHRMLNHHAPRNAGSYSNVPPAQGMDRNHSYSQRGTLNFYIN